MKNYIRHISLIVFVLLAFTALKAETIKTLPADPAIKSGHLPNGMSYYVASNQRYKGLADFALVQRTGKGTITGAEDSSVVDMALGLLESLYRLSAPSVQDYFERLGVLPGREGYVSISENATVFRFNNVMTGGSAQVMDSTLLVLMGMAEKSAAEPVFGGWFTPSDHALIVAGDVDADKVVEKMRMLSYMIPSAESIPREKYSWKKQDSLNLRRRETRRPGLATVSAELKLRRTPPEYMNTVQPLVFEKFMEESGMIASDRIRSAFKAMDMPFADISYDYLGSGEVFGDEIFRLSATVDRHDLTKAVSVLSSVLSSLDSEEIESHEVRRAGLVYRERLLEDAEEYDFNSDYVERCISAFILGTPLISAKDVAAFHTSKNLTDDMHLNFFNAIVPAAIDSTTNITLHYATADSLMTDAQVRSVFSSSWGTEGHDSSYEGDTLRLQALGEPAKVVRSRKEPISGGKFWNLSNGFKVVYKPMNTGGRMYYSLALNGGYANIPDLKEGEGAYMSDILKLSRIGGVGYDKFVDVMRQNGLVVDFKVGLSDLVMEGYAEDGSVECLMSMLLTVFNDSRIDREALDYYIGCDSLRHEYMKGSLYERISTIEGIICPDHRYSSYKSAGNLSSDFADRADRFMSFQSSKMDDGVLILVGDMAEKELKEILGKYAGGFKTQKRRFSRPVVNYQPISGTIAYDLEGESNTVDIIMSAPMSLTAENHYLASVAAVVLKKELSRRTAGMGMALSLRHKTQRYPQERFNLIISMEETSVEGYAPGTASIDAEAALSAVRDVLDNPYEIEISDNELSLCKSLLKDQLARAKNGPEYWLQAISRRYLDGKDFTSGADARIDAITADKIRELLALLFDSSRVEYIINRR